MNPTKGKKSASNDELIKQISETLGEYFTEEEIDKVKEFTVDDWKKVWMFVSNWYLNNS